jgi:hypothetical protein
MSMPRSERLTNETSAEERFFRSRAVTSSTRKSIDTQAIGSGASTGTITDWKGRRSSTRMPEARPTLAARAMRPGSG